MRQIKVFGEQADSIQEGQIFKAIKTSVEGRSVVILEPVITFDKDSCPSYEVRT